MTHLRRYVFKTWRLHGSEADLDRSLSAVYRHFDRLVSGIGTIRSDRCYQEGWPVMSYGFFPDGRTHDRLTGLHGMLTEYKGIKRGLKSERRLIRRQT